MSEIKFVWNGREYTVSAKVLGRKHIVLPNRKVIRPTRWLKADPPVLSEAQEVVHHLQHASLGEIADHVGDAILAHESE